MPVRAKKEHLLAFGKLSAVRRICNAYIEPRIILKYLGEVDPEIEIHFMPVALLRGPNNLLQFLVDLVFKFSLRIVIGLVKKASLQLFDVMKPMRLEWKAK